MRGIDAGDRSGRGVSGAGDVNGDGLADLIIGAYGADPGSDSRAGESYVVFGKADGVAVNLGALGDGGFRLEGIDASDYSGESVSGAGDVNGDGLADLIVGAWGADPGGDSSAGESYVVFGKADSATVDLGALGNGGFRLDGIDAADRSGYSVSGAGDVNGDGLADLIVGAYVADPGGDSSAGESYVVFGKADSATVNLGALGNGGFRLDGIDAADRSGYSVSGAGDVNGDGLADLIVGAPGAGSEGGESYVVFGKADSAAVNLGALGNGGFRLDGIDLEDFSGFSVSGAGDVNGDGLADLIVGAPSAGTNAGESYVVFGKADSAAVNLGALGNGGFRLDGIDLNDFSGYSVSGAGDVNGDGLADLIVGAPGAEAGGRLRAGESYVVFGNADGAGVNLGALGSGGFRLAGGDTSVLSGRSVSGAGDVNGDGLADLIVGAADMPPGGDSLTGESYVVFSQQVPALSAAYQIQVRNGDAPLRAIGTSGDGSNASHPDSRAWIDFADGNDPMADASPLIVTLTRNDGSFNASSADVSWQLVSNRLNWTSVEVTFRYLDSELSIGSENQLQLVFSANGNAPFTPLTSVVNPLNNTISAVVDQLGFFYLGQIALPEEIFSDGFE